MYTNKPSTRYWFFIGLYLIFLCSFPIGSISANSTDDWPMFRHDLRHTGYSTSLAPNNNNTLWSYTIGNWVGSSPAVTNGKVFVGSSDGNVYCLNEADGALIWSYTTLYAVDSSPAVAGGRVFVGSSDGNVYCLNEADGTMIWSYTTGWEVDSSPAVVLGKAFIGSDDGKIYCLNENDGALIWSYTTGGGGSSPAIADGRVFVGGGSEIYCLNEADGALIWSYRTEHGVYSSPAVADGKVFVGSRDGKVYCLNESDGALIWSYQTGGAVWPSPAVADGKVFVGSHDRNVYCLNETNGAMIWSYTTGYVVGSSPAVANGRVFVGSGDGRVYCFGLAVSPPMVETTDLTGNVKDKYIIEDNVYIVGSCYDPCITLDLYVVSDTDWNDGIPIPTRISGTSTKISSNINGDIDPTVVWCSPLTPGKYDVVVDVNGNGIYDDDIDALDDGDIEVTAGFFVIPELPFGTIMGIATCLMALGLFKSKRLNI